MPPLAGAEAGDRASDRSGQGCRICGQGRQINLAVGVRRVDLHNPVGNCGQPVQVQQPTLVGKQDNFVAASGAVEHGQVRKVDLEPSAGGLDRRPTVRWSVEGGQGRQVDQAAADGKELRPGVDRYRSLRRRTSRRRASNGSIPQEWLIVNAASISESPVVSVILPPEMSSAVPSKSDS